jgi:hypothetical protein
MATVSPKERRGQIIEATGVFKASLQRLAETAPDIPLNGVMKQIQANLVSLSAPPRKQIHGPTLDPPPSPSLGHVRGTTGGMSVGIAPPPTT